MEKIDIKFKDYRPICFEIFQSDMEEIMNSLYKVVARLARTDREGDGKLCDEIVLLKDSLQHKIDCHIERGEWK